MMVADEVREHPAAVGLEPGDWEGGGAVVYFGCEEAGDFVI